MRDGGWVFEQVAGGGEFLHDGGLRAEDCLAHQILVVGLSRLRSQPLWVLRQDATVLADDGPGLQGQLTPPDHVGDIAKGADHRDAGSLVLLCQMVGQHRNFNIEKRRANSGSKEGFVALVIGVCHQSHAGGNELGSGGDNDHIRFDRAMESHLVVGRGLVSILELRLSHRGSKGDVPQGWRVSSVGFAPL